MATLLRKIGFSRLRPPVVTLSPQVSRKGTVSLDVLRASSSSSSSGGGGGGAQQQHQQQHLAGVLNASGTKDSASDTKKQQQQQQQNHDQRHHQQQQQHNQQQQHHHHQHHHHQHHQHHHHQQQHPPAPASSTQCRQVRARRLMKELSELSRLGHEVLSVELVGESLFEWNVTLRQIDLESALWQDMREAGADGVLLNLTFPENFPFSPPFMRVLNPRIDNGFVLDGGAICMELLTPKGWSSAYTVEALVRQFAASLVKGQGRISRKKKAFTRKEAQATFRSLVKTHEKYGWVTPPSSDG
ncbi:ubiquitin-conjugating enzyme E2Q-like protein 1 [Petromyzon marinus]|uniref:ubiquitin-conjugating enzyme E2Q-like protein 1 n=1 Tax=Petromyzon marinus TaxID=7757 RepID=UPI003F70D08B